jgi:uncharacterized RDD family membrane protein YckC
MSTTPPGQDWWLASDGNWYPPTAAPGMGTASGPPPGYGMPPGYGPPPGYFVPTMPCSRCGQPEAPDRVACQNCGQVRLLPVGVVLTSAGRRFGQYLLDILLAVVTLFIGYLIWSLIIWGRGQTPAMQLLHIRVVKLRTAVPATWGTMFVREFLAKGLIMGLISAVFFPAWVVLCFMLLWDKNRQELWDKVADTIVVNDIPE